MALAVVVLAAAGAARSAEPPARWYLQVDNDVLVGTDRWYSSGVRIARVAPSADGAIEFGLLHEVYTPEAKYWEPGIDDRTPTARLLAYGARHYADLLCDTTFELDLGVRGPSAIGRQATEGIHRIVPAPKVDWSRQDSDRVDIQLAAVRSHRMSDLVGHYGAVVGNQQVFAHTGIEWHVGSRSTRAVLTPAMRFAATPPPAAGDPGWDAFVGASARAVARNVMIRGNYDPAGPELEPRHAVARAAIGVATVQRWGSAALSVATDTREFDAQRRPQVFGSLTVHVEF
jgi:hypothetical protein